MTLLDDINTFGVSGAWVNLYHTTKGMTGVTGTQGVTGPTGSDGYTGPTGPHRHFTDTGSTGAAGWTGTIGWIGMIGFTGWTGMTGLTGPGGLNGSVGPTGPTGPGSIDGCTGVTGVTGNIGFTGPMGGGGITGPTGPTGGSGTLTVTYTTSINVNVSGQTGAIGPLSSYTTDLSDPYDLVDTLNSHDLWFAGVTGTITRLAHWCTNKNTITSGSNTSIIRKNGVETSMTTTYTSAGIPYSETITNQVSVGGYDYIDIIFNCGSTDTVCRYGFMFTVEI